MTAMGVFVSIPIALILFRVLTLRLLVWKIEAIQEVGRSRE